MDGNIMSGLGGAIIALVIIVFIIGGIVVGGIWTVVSFTSDDEYQSTEKVLYPTRYEIHGNEEKIDTTYYYDLQEND